MRIETDTYPVYPQFISLWIDVQTSAARASTQTLIKVAIGCTVALAISRLETIEKIYKHVTREKDRT